MQASAGKLLGHDAVPRQGRRQEVSDHGRKHQGQDRLVVAGELEEEDDRGEGRPGRRPECGGHGDEGEGARRDVDPRDTGRQAAEQGPEGAADEQDGGQRSSRRA